MCVCVAVSQTIVYLLFATLKQKLKFRCLETTTPPTTSTTTTTSLASLSSSSSSSSRRGEKNLFYVLTPSEKNRKQATAKQRSNEDFKKLGSGCGSVGRMVASDTRDPRFKSSKRQKFYEHCLLSTVLK